MSLADARRTLSSDTPSSEESAAAAREGGWPKALLLALALFFASERLIWRAPNVLGFLARNKSPTRVGDPFIPTTAFVGPSPLGAPPVILLGSSQVREGLDCDVFEERLPGRPCRNMALSAGTPLDLLYVDRTLDHAVSRRTTLIGLFPGMFQTEPKKSFTDLETVRCLVSSGSIKRLQMEDGANLVFGLLASRSPTLRHKDGLWEIYRRLGDEMDAAWSGQMAPSPERVLDGRDPQPRHYFEERLGKVNRDVTPTRFTPGHEEALGRLLSREHARGNTVWVVDFPTRPGYETTITREAVTYYAALLDRLRRRADAVFVSAAQMPALGPDDFFDFTHLARGGRAKVSRRLADLVAASEAGGVPDRP